ncbi:MAG: hypothetical protein ACK5WO_13830 [Cyclobacteriaceae bacterium]|jgi:hypothetical protein
MKNWTKDVAMLILLSFTLSSCGVIFGGSKFSGSIIAKDHPNAQIYVNGNNIGKGTAIGLYPRNRPLTVELKQEGCENKTQTFDKTFRTGNFILSLLSWGLVGIAIDLGTGASYKPDHKSNPAIQKMTDKNFTFTVDYPGCPNK